MALYPIRLSSSYRRENLKSHTDEYYLCIARYKHYRYFHALPWILK
jgi:hypothetical protein